MRRHLLIGTLGRQDNAAIPSAPDEIVTRFPLDIQTALRDLKSLHIFPSEIGVDLLHLAAHVHAADTRISRFTESQDTWTRELRLVVPVSTPQLWAATSDLLARMLNFLTGDKWAIGFRPRPVRFSSIVPRRSAKLISPPFDSVSLFSGGLDSLIGAIDALEAGQIPLLVSHAGEGATSDAQNQCASALNGHYRKNPFNRLRLWLNFPTNLVRDVESENTTRGRSFLFFALGVFA